METKKVELIKNKEVMQTKLNGEIINIDTYGIFAELNELEINYFLKEAFSKRKKIGRHDIFKNMYFTVRKSYCDALSYEQSKEKKVVNHFMYLKNGYGISDSILNRLRLTCKDVDTFKIIILEFKPVENIINLLSANLKDYLNSTEHYVDRSKGFNDPQSFVNINDFEKIASTQKCLDYMNQLRETEKSFTSC